MGARSWHTPERTDDPSELEDHPIHLWEALFWRGYTYRTELVGGEVPLVGALGTPAAAAATFEQLLADARRLFGDEVERAEGWTRCGPFRVRRGGRRVELRVRLAPADRRVVFLPQSRAPGAEGLPSILGCLLAGGDKGKTELWDGWTWTTLELESAAEAREVADALLPVIAGWIGAPVSIGERPQGDVDESAAPWVVEPYERFLRVYVPFHRLGCLPWRVQAGHFAG